MAGRRPKPSALKVLEGNRGKRAINKSEPKPQSGAPEASDWLAPAALEKWNSIVPQLTAIKVLTVVDGSALESLCAAYTNMVESQRIVTKYGVIIEEPVLNKDGVLVGHKLKKNPASTAVLQHQKEYRALLSAFGLTPSDRSRLKTDSGEKELSPLAKLLQGRSEARAKRSA